MSLHSAPSWGKMCVKILPGNGQILGMEIFALLMLKSAGVKIKAILTHLMTYQTRVLLRTLTNLEAGVQSGVSEVQALRMWSGIEATP